MPYIQPEPFTFLNIKFTDHGRRLASAGRLNIDTVVLSDREIDYRVDDTDQYNILNNRILDISHFYPDIENLNFDGSSSFSRDEFKIGYERIQVTASTVSGSVSSQRRGTGNFVYSSNGANWGLNKATFGGLTYSPQVGDLVFIPWIDPAFSGTYQLDTLPSTQPSVVLTYRIISAQTATTFFLDRPIPEFAGGGPTLECEFYYDNLIEDHIGISKSVDPGVWNMNIVRTQNVPGMDIGGITGISGYTTFGSIEYNGTRHFFGFDDNPVSSAGFGNGDIPIFGLIHYTNKYSGNTYGEQFVEGTFELNLPTVMWHHGYNFQYDNTGSLINSFNSSGTTWGLFANDRLGLTYFDQFAKSTFRNLYDGQNTGVTIGRVYHKLKVVLITDQELLTALTYKSNRNYTLPPFNLTLSSTPQIGMTPANAFSGLTVSGLSATGLVKTGFDYFVTYIAECDDYAAGTSIGNPPAMHCGYIQKLVGTTDENNIPQYLQIDFPYPNSFPYMRDDAALAAGTYDSGWNANTVQILLNIQPTDFDDTGYNSNNVPYNQWRRISNKSLGGNGVYRASDWGDNTIDPKKLNAYKFVISEEDYYSGSTYSLYSGCTSNQRFLNFGDECFVYGSIRTDILSTVYKMKVSVYLPENDFNGSNNATFNRSNDGDEVYITEVALLADDLVVAVGKPTYPIRKSNTRMLTLLLDYDF